MLKAIAQRTNSALDNIVSQVVGGLFLGKFVGDYGLLVSRRVFGDAGGPAIQPGADLPFFAGIAVAVGLLVVAAEIKSATDRFAEEVEEITEHVDDEYAPLDGE